MSMRCNICPRKCGKNRRTEYGFCGVGEHPSIARAEKHFWEEPYISGEHGSGAVFFCGCNLDCVFCQNHEINKTDRGIKVNADTLSEIFLRLQSQSAHNINLVTPAPHLHIIIPAIKKAKAQGLKLPVVYNTNAYETMNAIRALEGLVDIYLPDLKYITSKISQKYSAASNYFIVASTAIKEMYRQRGDIVLDENGVAKSGVAVRHLVLPAMVDETRRVLSYLSENYPKTLYISLMGQYIPCHRAEAPIDRPLLKREYNRAVEHCQTLGFEHVFIQSLNSASKKYVPEFAQAPDNK